MDPTFIPSRPTRRPFLAAVETLLWILSFGCLAAVLYILGDAWWFQSRAARHWRAEAAERAVVRSTAPADASRASLGSPPLRHALPGAPIGLLKIPRLQVSVMVAEGTSEDVLQHAVGHLSSSSKPGNGNSVLAGHRDTFFRPLESIRPYDRIVFDDGERVHRYQVEWVDIVEPDRTDLLAPSTEPVLTLITCYPFRYIGSAPQRFVVRARELRPDEGRTDEGRRELPAG